MREVECPACGALIEEPNDEHLIEAARLHALDAHHYDLPPDHVLQLARDAP